MLITIPQGEQRELFSFLDRPREMQMISHEIE